MKNVFEQITSVQTCDDWDSIQWILALNNSKILNEAPINPADIVDDGTVLYKIRELRVCTRLPSPTDILSEDWLNNSNIEKAHNLTSSGDQCKTKVDPDSRELYLVNDDNIPKCCEDLTAFHDINEFREEEQTSEKSQCNNPRVNVSQDSDIQNASPLKGIHDIKEFCKEEQTSEKSQSNNPRVNFSQDSDIQNTSPLKGIHDIKEFCEEEQTSEKSQCSNSRVNISKDSAILNASPLKRKRRLCIGDVSQDSDILNASPPKRKRRICIEEFYVLEAGCSDKYDNHKQTETENESTSEFVCSTPELYSHRRYNYHRIDGKSPKVKVGNLPLDNIFAKYLNEDTPRRKRRRLK